jgi:hypothetical protein
LKEKKIIIIQGLSRTTMGRPDLALTHQKNWPVESGRPNLAPKVSKNESLNNKTEMVLEATQNVNPKGQDWDDQPIGVPKNEKGKIRTSHRNAHTPRGSVR